MSPRTTRVTRLVYETPVGGVLYRAKQALTYLTVFLAVYVTWLVMPTYMANYRLEDFIQQTARESAYNDDEEYQIHDKIMQRAKELSVPLKEENLVVTREEKLVRIQAAYQVPIKLATGRVITLNFTPFDSEKTLSHEAIQVKKAKEGK